MNRDNMFLSQDTHILRKKHIFLTGESAGLGKEMEAGGGLPVFL